MRIIYEAGGWLHADTFAPTTVRDALAAIALRAVNGDELIAEALEGSPRGWWPTFRLLENTERSSVLRADAP